MNSSPTLFQRLLPLAAVLLLDACGGGSGSTGAGSGDSPPPVPEPNVNPIAAFNFDPESGPAPLAINFDGGTSSDSDGTIVSHRWDFGDGTTDRGEQVQHQYLEDGSYTVTLQVIDNNQGTDSIAAVVEVDSSIFLSGTIQVLASSAVDIDVNDPAASSGDNTGDNTGDNNSFETAQLLPNPVTLGGYVNLAGFGSSGALSDDGDPRDVYTVSLTGNETILLAAAEANTDLDLFLYDADGSLVDGSVSPGNQTESLNVDQAGTYFLEVIPSDGASNYVMTVGQNQITNSRALRLSHQFVPGEVLVTVEQHKPEPAIAGVSVRRRGARGMRVMGLDNPELALAAMRHGKQRPPALARRISRDMRQRLDTLLTMKGLAKQDHVSRVEPNLMRYASRVPDDTFYGNQWHYPNISLPQAWDLTTGDESVIVAVIDTGVLLEHPDFEGQLVPGYDFISDANRSGDGDGRDPDPNDPGDAQPGLPSSFHGTHVSGTIAAASNNGIGVAGVAWDARIMPLRVLGQGGGTSFDLIQAILFAAGESNLSGTVPEQPADIINMSLGGDFFSQSEQDAVATARANGVIVVAAAGNAGSTEPGYPAAYDGVLSVSATTISKSLAFYSNRGPTVDLAAPGGSSQTDINGDGFGDGVASTLADDSDGNLQFGYGILMGTSMASPHVAGVAALMKSVHPALTPDEFDQALVAGLLTEDLGDDGRDDSFGNGLINAQRAVVTALGLASGNTEFPPLAAVTPTTINFGAFDDLLGFDVVSVGGDGLEIISLDSAASWLTVTPMDTSPTGVGRYQAAVTRGNLGDGIYATTIEVTTNVNSLSLPVIMQVSGLDLDADAGYHYILLIDASTDRIVDQLEMPAQDGEYRFRFNNVEPGRYQIIAGSDSDNDFLICDNGESCGSYQTLDSPQLFEVDGALAGLNFITGFLVNFAEISAAVSTAPVSSKSSGVARRPR